MEMAEPGIGQKRPWLQPLLSGVLFSFALCVYAPVETCLSAGAELWFGVTDFLWPMLFSFILMAAAFFGACMLLRGLARDALCSLLVGLTVALYVQGAFANADYGVLDGRAIDWAGFGSYPIWNTVMWAVLALLPVALALIFRARAQGALRFVSAALCLMLSVSLGASALAQPKGEAYREAGFTTEGEFTLSSGKNVVVFVLDTMDTTTFSELLEHKPELADRLDGFTWFSRMVGQYPVTTFAMPALLTGTGYLYETSKGVYEQSAWEKDRFFHALKAEGYQVGVYSESEYAMEEAVGLVDNVALQPMVPTSALTLWQRVMRLAGFRYAPHVLKPSLVLSTTDFDPLKKGADSSVYTFDDEKFLRDFRAAGLSAEEPRPCFRLYHLQGAHTPYNLKADGTRGDSSLHEQVLSVLGGALSYFDQMKAMGVYDDATIVITADHGNMTIDPAPLLLVKRPEDAGPLVANENLVWQQDLHATIAAAAGLREKITYGTDAFALTADDLREAAYYNYYWAQADRFYEYAVTTDDEGELLYKATGRVYMYGDVLEPEPPAYTLGDLIPFRKPSDAVAWCDEMGNYLLTQADRGVWFGAPAARLNLALAGEEYDDLRVTLGVSEIKGDSQVMKVIYDDQVQEELVIRKGDDKVSFVVPWDAVTDGVLAVTLRFPQAVSAYRESGWASGDTRLRAVAFTDMVIESIE